MANPQLEDGYTSIANELMEAVARNLPGGSKAQILLAIIRKTYGYHKKADTISISQLQELTSLGRRTVILGLQNLEAMKMIVVKRQRGRGNVNLPNTVSLQKNYDLWVVQRKSPQYAEQLQKQRLKYQSSVVQRIEGSAKNSSEVVQRTEKQGEIFAPTKDTKTKDTKTKDNTKSRYFFGNIHLTVDEYDKLVERFGEAGTKDRLEGLSLYKQSRGRRYESDYATVLAWERRDQKGDRYGAHKGLHGKIPARDQYTRPKPNARLDRLVEQEREVDPGSGSNEPR